MLQRGAIVVVLAACLATTLLLSAAISSCFAAEPTELVRFQVLHRPVMVASGKRLAVAVQDARQNHGELNALIGLSSMRDDVDPVLLEQSWNVPSVWVNLSGAGGSMVELAYVAQPLVHLLRSRAHDVVHPTRVVLGLHAEWLAELDPKRVLKRSRWVDPRSRLEHMFWVTRNAGAMGAGITFVLDHLRARTLLAAGLGPKEIYGLGLRSPVYETGDTPQTHAHWTLQLMRWDDQGWFDASRYPEGGVQARALENVLEAFTRAHTEVFVVYMPGHSLWRERTPSVATSLLMRTVARHVDEAHTLDLRDAIPDRKFADHSHLLRSGREETTQRLASWLQGR